MKAKLEYSTSGDVVQRSQLMLLASRADRVTAMEGVKRNTLTRRSFIGRRTLKQSYLLVILEKGYDCA